MHSTVSDVVVKLITFRPFVVLSVTFQYSAKTAKCIFEILPLPHNFSFLITKQWYHQPMEA